jgi:hypothetical protein
MSALAVGPAEQAHLHLRECDACRSQWDQMNADKKHFDQFVFGRTLPAIETRLEAKPPRFRGLVRFFVPAMSAALAASAVFLVIERKWAVPETDEARESYVGIKGHATLELFAVRGNGGVFAVGPETALKPKDRIRFVVNPGDAQYVLIASIDAGDRFSVYFPFGANQSEALTKRQAKVELPGAVELDDTVGTELLVAVFSDEPIAASVVDEAVRANPDQPRIPGASVVVRRVVKASL